MAVAVTVCDVAARCECVIRSTAAVLSTCQRDGDAALSEIHASFEGLRSQLVRWGVDAAGCIHVGGRVCATLGTHVALTVAVLRGVCRRRSALLYLICGRNWYASVALRFISVASLYVR